jgi:YfiR/HmsC-like
VETVTNSANPSSPWSAASSASRQPCDRTYSGSFLRFLLILVVFLSGTKLCTAGGEVHPTESQVKAAYLYNFGKFVRWPTDGAPTPEALEICVLGKDPFGAALDATVVGESIDGRKIKVTRLAKVQDATRCNILFISASEESQLTAILSAVQHFGPLTVSDIPHFAERGGIIEFIPQQGRIRFEVNRAAAEQSHVTLSSELLKVAVKVIDRTAPRSQP